MNRAVIYRYTGFLAHDLFLKARGAQYDHCEAQKTTVLHDLALEKAHKRPTREDLQESLMEIQQTSRNDWNLS